MTRTPLDVNLYLVGFMGTGKTTIGRAVAARMGFRLLDSDQEIEKAAGRTIAEIFAQDGEPAFRSMERDFIENGHPDRGCVVACGGGLVVQPGMLERLNRKGVVVREPVYKRAGTVILTDGRPAGDIIAHLLRAYRREALDWLRAHPAHAR
jgi:hypothetical protein